jgi:hypothetical protein
VPKVAIKPNRNCRTGAHLTCAREGMAWQIRLSSKMPVLHKSTRGCRMRPALPADLLLPAPLKIKKLHIIAFSCKDSAASGV